MDSNCSVGCVTSVLTAEQTQQLQAAKRIQNEEAFRAAQVGMSVEQLRAVNAYTRELRIKFPHMKPDRLQRKVAEYFKIKLVKNAGK